MSCSFPTEKGVFKKTVTAVSPLESCCAKMNVDSEKMNMGNTIGYDRTEFESKWRMF